MNHQESQRIAIAPTLLIAAALLLGSPSFAEVVSFRVAFERLPGTEEIEAGNMRAGIKVLEDQLNQIEQEISGDILATLCAAYIVDGSLDKAEVACNKAVEIDPTETAYNNRGVFRAFTGDFLGAREDFDRVRPRQLEAYMEEQRKKDVPLMAIDNFHLTDELLAKGASSGSKSSFAISTAEIENIDD